MTVLGLFQEGSLMHGDRERLRGNGPGALAWYARAPGSWRSLARQAAVSPLPEALELYRAAHKLGGPEPEVLLPGADALLRAGQLDEAQAWLRECLAAYPGRAEALALMARLSLARGEVTATRRWAAHLLELNPSSQVARQLLAQAAESTGQWRLAAAEYGRAVGTLPATDGAMHFNAAVCLVKAQDPAGALQHVTRALELNPQLLGGYLLAHDLSGDRRFLEALIRTAPSSPEAGVARGRL